MKITSQEEYGLRILLRIGACRDKQGMNIPQLSEAEGLTQHYVAKLARVLRMGGFINSTPGYKGGYVLAKPAKEIVINDVLKLLGGVVFDKKFCAAHTGSVRICTNSVDCSARSLWQMIQFVLDRLLDRITLHDLVNPETESVKIMTELLYEPARPAEV
ncbi:RrF2 family transcriptional regulator [Flavihumibacter stibioxidans]|uniref:Rrf2 family transcriptional regulator n=1 Tax=Flavihumibacter stibioxidans TaxID=1834163 RepID=A0ABR7M7H9_9BACT|nr:Rrf2 family transcriptional regulator [Flavihumibacter stibioxidans]MBC6490984.1 Rrf2 family transcriptional regulator [Flavihumibacter stibioxidans]